MKELKLGKEAKAVDGASMFQKSWSIYGALSEKNYMHHREIYAQVESHYIQDPSFSLAIQRFLEREKNGIGHYLDELAEHSPLKSKPSS